MADHKMQAVQPASFEWNYFLTTDLCGKRPSVTAHMRRYCGLYTAYSTTTGLHPNCSESREAETNRSTPAEASGRLSGRNSTECLIRPPLQWTSKSTSQNR